MPGENELTNEQQVALWDGLRLLAELPDWVLAATDSERVSRALRQSIPEFLSGQWALMDCDIRHVRFKDGRWTGSYQLTVEEKALVGKPETVTWRGTLIPPEKRQGRPMEVGGDFRAQAWHGYLPDMGLEFRVQEPEKVLAALSRLTDPEQARELLETSIRAGSPAYSNLHIQTCNPQVVRYTPGSRCTIVYQLQYPAEPDGHRPELVVAKTYRGDKGLNAYEGMRALWESPLGANQTVTIAEPLAYLPEIKVLVQGPVREEQTLKEMVRSAISKRTTGAMEEVLHFMRKTAAGVVALHRSNVRFGPAWKWENELADVQEMIEDLAQAIPSLKAAAGPLLNRLQDLETAHPDDPAVPAHGSFRPAQVLIHQGRIGFIDFDSFCQAEPALDLALFMGNVKSIGLTIAEDDEDAQALDPVEQEARLAQLEAACQVFLEEYQAALPVSRERIALWEALDLLTIILHSWTKVKPVRLKNTMFLLKHHLRTSRLADSREPSYASR